MKLEILAIDFHRNGIGGAPFYVVLFHDGESRKVGILFREDYRVAVLDVQKLASGDIASGSNSWRGDFYESPLRTAIKRRSRNDARRPKTRLFRSFREFLRRMNERAGWIF